jgi:nucleoporin POM152
LLHRYTRSENPKKGKGNASSRKQQPGKILETRHDTSDDFTKVIRASDEGVYEVVSIKDRFCSYSKVDPNGSSGTAGRKRLTY